MVARKFRTAAVAVLVLVAAVGPALAAGGQASSSITATVEVTDTETVITVLQDGSTAAGAQVSISSVAGGQYAASGTYTADADGTVRLPAPVESTQVELGVEHDAVGGATTVDLTVPESGAVRQTVAFDIGASDSPSVQAHGGADVSGQSTDAVAGSTDVSAGDTGVSASSQGNVGDWAEVRSEAKLLGQFGYLGQVGFDIPSSDVPHADVAASGESAVEQSGSSVAGNGGASASGVAAGSAVADGSASAAVEGASAVAPGDNSSTLTGEMDSSVGAEGAVSSVGGESSGSLSADAESTDSGTAVGIAGSIVGLEQVDGRTELAASSE